MTRAPDPHRPMSALLRAGAILAGKYKVERVLGRGGMGLVLAAKHRHLGERVAIKLLLPGTPVKADAFERFLREGRATARLRSEHVARVFDAGVLESGEPYLVLEYLDGVDLRALMQQRGELPVETAVLYVLQACEALAEAHSLGIVHRDLKPANLFLTRRPGGARVVKVIDFGISKITSPDSDDHGEAQITEHGTAIGTPRYMAPEQMRSARAADARADIWSLGAVLFGLLTGSPPFTGESVLDVYDRILEGAPSLRAARADVPSALEEVVHRCLRLRPEARYEDVGQLAAALVSALPDAPPEARALADRTNRIARGLPPEDAGEDNHGRDDAESTGVETLRAASTDGFSMEPATIDTSSASEGLDSAATEEPRDPSWVPRRAQDRPPARRRTVALILACSLAAAVAGAAIRWGKSDPPVDPRARESASGATTAPLATAAISTPGSAVAASAATTVPAVATTFASTTATPPTTTQPRRQIATTPSASAISTARASSSPPARSVPDMAETPD